MLDASRWKQPERNMEDDFKMGVHFTHQGNFIKTENYLKSLLHKDYLSILNKYGQMGVEALAAATPVDTGRAANSWSYEITNENGCTSLIWTNNDIEGGINVVLLVDKGHCTKSGSWVPGQNFIDPAISPIIAQIAREVAV